MAYWETARASEMSPREDTEKEKERKKTDGGERSGRTRGDAGEVGRSPNTKPGGDRKSVV